MTDTTQDRETLITLTSDIVAAHVSNNNVPVEQVSALISSVFDALSGLGAEPVAVEAPREPAVSIRASVKPDHVTCLECGRQMKMLKRHLSADHGLSVDEYRQRWGLSASHPLVAPNYAATRADLAKKIGLGRGGRKSSVSGSTLQAATPALAKKNAKSAVESDAQPSKRRKLLQRQKEAGDSPASALKASPVIKTDVKRPN